MAEVASTFQKRPAYRYIRETDKLPVNVDGQADPVCKVRLFNPTGVGTWWIASYDPETGNAYGVAHIHEREAGYFHMPELVNFRGRMGLPIERTTGWSPKPMSEILKGAY